MSLFKTTNNHSYNQYIICKNVRSHKKW